MAIDPQSEASLQGRRVLAVAADAATIRYVQEALTPLGCEVRGATTLASAEAVGRGGFDLLVVRYNLPGYAAEELVRRLRLATGAEVPVVALLGDGGEIPDALVIESFRAGADCHLSAEGEADELRRFAVRVLSERRSE